MTLTRDQARALAALLAERAVANADDRELLDAVCNAVKTKKKHAWSLVATFRRGFSRGHGTALGDPPPPPSGPLFDEAHRLGRLRTERLLAAYAAAQRWPAARIAGLLAACAGSVLWAPPAVALLLAPAALAMIPIVLRRRRRWAPRRPRAAAA